MSNVLPSGKGDKPIRSVIINGEPWFVAADVCKHLGTVSTGKMFTFLRKLAPEEHQLITRDSPEFTKATKAALFTAKSSWRFHMMSLSAVYKCILRSTTPEALAFQNWVIEELLSSLSEAEDSSDAAMRLTLDQGQIVPLPACIAAALHGRIPKSGEEKVTSPSTTTTGSEAPAKRLGRLKVVSKGHPQEVNQEGVPW